MNSQNYIINTMVHDSARVVFVIKSSAITFKLFYLLVYEHTLAYKKEEEEN